MGPCTAVDIEEVHVRLLRVHFSSPIAAVAVAAPASASFCHEIVKLLPLLALSTATTSTGHSVAGVDRSIAGHRQTFRL